MNQSRDSMTIQDDAYDLSPTVFHSILGYELYEVIEDSLSKLPYKLRNQNRVRDISYRIDLAEYIDSIGMLNSFLFKIDTTKDYLKKDIQYLSTKLSVLFNINELDIDVLNDKLFYLYLYNMDINPSNLLKLEFFRYLPKMSDRDIISIGNNLHPNLLFPTNLMGEYFHFLYKHKKISLKEIEKLILDGDINANPLQTTLQLIFKDAISGDSEKDIKEIMEVIDKYNKRYPGVYLTNTIVTVGKKKWIKWLIKEIVNEDEIEDESEEDSWDTIWSVISVGYNENKLDVVIDSLEEEGYNVFDLVMNGDSDTYYNIMNKYLANRVGIKRLTEAYNNEEGNGLFKQWFKNIVVNQV